MKTEAIALTDIQVGDTIKVTLDADGNATAVVINTGFSTYLGSMGKQIDSKNDITNFERGMNNITTLSIR